MELSTHKTIEDLKDLSVLNSKALFPSKSVSKSWLHCKSSWHMGKCCAIKYTFISIFSEKIYANSLISLFPGPNMAVNKTVCIGNFLILGGYIGWTMDNAAYLEDGLHDNTN